MKIKAYAIRGNKVVCELAIPQNVTSDNKHEWILGLMETMKYDWIFFLTEEDFKRLFF